MSPKSQLNRSHAIAASHYAVANFSLGQANLFNQEALHDLPHLQDQCRALPADPAPGLRRRAKSEALLAPDGTVTPVANLPYQQDYDGAVLGARQIAEIDTQILALRTYTELLQQHRTLARLCQPALFEAPVREIVHLINYAPVGVHASFAHPLQNHADREVFVGLTVLEYSANLVGGGNNLFIPGARLPTVHLQLDVL
jgi:hypothetical protein